jgi:hypothetical protein
MATPRPPSDPDVKIPASVARSAALADELLKQQQAAQDGVTQEGNEPQEEAPQEQAPGETQLQKTEGSAEAARQRNARGQWVRELEQQPSQEFVQQAEPQAQEPARAQEPTPKGDDQTWEARYKSLNGRIEKQSRVMQEQNQQIQNLQGLLAQMQHPSKEEQKAPTPESFLTPEERESYGDDFLQVVGKKANEIVAPLKRELEDKIKELNQRLGSVGGTVQQSLKDRMDSTLDQEVPQWRQLNETPAFLEWLQLTDPYSGTIRINLLRDAYGQCNTPRVAAFFKGFLAEEAATAPRDQEATPQAAAPQSAPQPGKPSLDQFAAPGRAKSAAGPAPAEKPFFTRAQIATFYAASTAGKFAGREAEKQKIEAQIFEAQREGRVR